MRLIDRETGIDIVFHEDAVSILSIENRKAYANFLEHLWCQIDGKEGNLILSEDEKEIAFSKYASIIFNPFAVSCNEKKVLTKLYQEIKEIAEEQFQEQIAEVLANNYNLIDMLIEKQEFALDYKLDFNILDMFKLFDIRLRECDEDALVHVSDYIKLLSRICRIKLFVFVGLKNYFSDDELKELYQDIFNEKVYLLDIESRYDYALNGEMNCVLDKDMCIIDI